MSGLSAERLDEIREVVERNENWGTDGCYWYVDAVADLYKAFGELSAVRAAAQELVDQVDTGFDIATESDDEYGRELLPDFAAVLDALRLALEAAKP